MDTITSSREWLPITRSLQPGQIHALLAPHAGAALMLETAARLSVHGSVRVLDGGNQFNAYHVARSIRRLSAELEPALTRIHLARAFTCYQVETLICGAATSYDVPGRGAPVTLVFDLLGTFADDNVSLVERRRLLERCRLAMRQIAAHSVLLVGLRPARAGHPDQDELLQIVLGWVDNLWQAEVPVRAAADDTVRRRGHSTLIRFTPSA